MSFSSHLLMDQYLLQNYWGDKANGTLLFKSFKWFGRKDRNHLIGFRRRTRSLDEAKRNPGNPGLRRAPSRLRFLSQ